MLVTMEVLGVVLAPEQDSILLLREPEDDERCLPIWVGDREAAALITAQHLIAEPRPGTITLLQQVIQALGHGVERAEITELRDGVFLAELVLTGDIRVAARPSDAVAVALRAAVPVGVDTAVLDEAAVEVVLDPEWDHDLDPDQQVSQFRAFLNEVSPDDFTNP